MTFMLIVMSISIFFAYRWYKSLDGTPGFDDWDDPKDWD